YQMGSVMLGLGKTNAALEEYKRAHAVLRQLAEDEPQSDMNRGNLALLLTTLGDMELKMHGAEAARSYYEEGRELREDIVEHPRNKDLTPEETRRSLAGSYTKLAMIAISPAEKESFIRKALELQSSLAAKDKASLDLKGDLGLSYV